MNTELVRIVDSISRDKNIEKDEVFADLETAMESAVRKAYNQTDEVQVAIDRLTGEISASRNGESIQMKDLGRIAAQTAKQVMIQKIREAERGSIFEEFSERKSTVVTGTVSRFEGGALIVNLGRTEGFLPKSEQIPGETHHPGERIRCLILDVREAPNQVKIVLSRSHPDFIRRLFELEVPEVAERIIEIKALAREAGYRTKIAVSSIDMKVDAVGACVGVRGSRIKNIVVELGGEKIDIVRWNESSQILITNALKPAEVQETALCFELGRATVVVAEDQLSLAIGKRGQNVRLAARLTGWDIDILTPAEYNKGLDQLEKVLTEMDGIDNQVVDKLVAIGIISLMDLEEVGVSPLVNEMSLDEGLATRVISRASEAAKQLAAEAEAKKKEEAAAKAAAEALAAEGGEPEVAESEADASVAALFAPVDAGASQEASGETGEAVPVDDAAAPGDAEPPSASETSAEVEAAVEAESTPTIEDEGADANTAGTSAPAAESELEGAPTDGESTELSEQQASS
jgi:N utilization substance protein A